MILFQDLSRSLRGLGVLCFLVGCGPVLKQSMTEVAVQADGAGLTEGTTPEGQRYTGFGPSVELADLKKDTDSKGNEFSAAIMTIERKVSSASEQSSRLEIVVTRADGASSRFSGELICQKHLCKGSLEKSGPEKTSAEGLADANQIEITCESSQCRLLKGVFIKNENRLGGFILRDEERVLERTYRNYRNGAVEVEELPAHVVSTEILGGISKVQIQSGTNKKSEISTVEVPLVETDGECVDLKKTETSTCLMGNSKEGEILLRESPTENENTYLRVLPRKINKMPEEKNASEENLTCLGGLQGTGAHPWVLQAARECERSEIKSGIQVWSQTAEKKRFESFLALRDLSPGSPAGKIMDPAAFHVMLRELRGLGLPEVMAFVSYVESRFQARLRSGAGAVGWWQLMPGTAIENGLKLRPIDERSDIQRSTVAAGKFLLTISKTPQWNQNLAMTLAAYNMGQNGLLQKVHHVKTFKKSQMTIEELVRFSADFWLLSRLRVLPVETRNYVPRIFSAMKISLSPQQYGVSGPAFSTR
ncbi:MAG: transglycosylase SLT domain-containing protein [Bdellovibrionales bacterium]|nr:transglycosylase SLT domain-containing protein [Bdellovibrionales bacterium]